MKLVEYRVRKFRSVQDSGLVTLDQVNALLGENESGKTNLLLPLWKLNPSSGGEISLLSDAPRGEYTEVRETPDDDKPIFVTAIFELNSREKVEIASIANCSEDWLEIVSISRRFDGEYVIQFPQANPPRTTERTEVLAPIKDFITSLNELQPNKTDIKPKARLIEFIDALLTKIETRQDEVGTKELQEC